MTQPMIVESESKTCERPGADGAACGQPAVFAFAWEWGETGHCCALHGQLLQQIASQINRTVALQPLATVPQPMGRDERISLTARALVLEEEVNVAKLRGLELYRINEQIHGEMRLHQVRAEEARVQMMQAQAEAERLRAELERNERENAELLAENERLKLFASLQPSTGGGGGGG